MPVDVWFVLVCRQCGPPLLPMPFTDQADRQRWATEHTEGCGHDDYLMVEHDREFRLVHVG